MTHAYIDPGSHSLPTVIVAIDENDDDEIDRCEFTARTVGELEDRVLNFLAALGPVREVEIERCLGTCASLARRLTSEGFRTRLVP